jgi:hypothetical protein
MTGLFVLFSLFRLYKAKFAKNFEKNFHKALDSSAERCYDELVVFNDKHTNV